MEQKNFDLAVQLRHELHQHPELSNKETWTKQHLMDFLKTHTKLEVVDRGLWFYAAYHKDDNLPSIAFRADFDAIPVAEGCDVPYQSQFPGIAHKCGHDGHSASLAGLALEVDQFGADQNVYFVFQHAEETGDGAKDCAEVITEHNIGEIYAFHNMSGYPKDAVCVRNGTMNCASKGMVIHMDGVPAHASTPELGKNPAYAITKVVDAIPELTDPAKHKGLILCTVIQIDLGERAFGVSAYKGDLLLTIRAQYEDEMDVLQAGLEKIALEQAEQYGLKCGFSFYDEFPETANDPECADKIRAVSKELKLSIFEMEEPLRGSEDFGHYLKRTKGAIFYVGNGENYPPVHSVEFDFLDGEIAEVVEIFKSLITK